jgi:voltage-gated potassium channel
LQASWRDTRLLLSEFRWPLLIFCLVILGGGILYYLLFEKCQHSSPGACGETVDNLAEAVYIVLTLSFFQPSGDFPRVFYLEVFYFLMPVIGLGILAQGVAEFGIMLFNRNARSREWEMAVASTYNNHIIVIGLGHLGYRVVMNLLQMEQEIVVIEKDPKIDLANSVKSLGIPVLYEDGKREATLEGAGVRQAKAIILCSQNDILNLQIALKSRALNPQIRVILRIFEEDFAASLQEQFGFTAMSATRMAAPAFAAASAGIDVTQPIILDGQSLSLAKLTINPQSSLADLFVGDVEKRFSVSIVLVKNSSDMDLHPDVRRQLCPGEHLAILGGQKEINRVMQANQTGIGLRGQK